MQFTIEFLRNERISYKIKENVLNLRSVTLLKQFLKWRCRYFECNELSE